MDEPDYEKKTLIFRRGSGMARHEPWTGLTFAHVLQA